jgi:hypothetical protein
MVNDQPPITGTPSKAAVANATALAQTADVVVFVIGGDWSVEHEAMDRTSIDLPGSQTEVVTSIAASLKPGVPVVVVLIHGGRGLLTSIFPALRFFYLLLGADDKSLGKY